MSFSIGLLMEGANKETVGSKDRAAHSVHQLITAANTDNSRWELGTSQYILCAQAMDLDLCLEYFSSSICAVSYQCFLQYKLLFSLRTPKEITLILIYDKQELRSLFY